MPASINDRDFLVGLLACQQGAGRIDQFVAAAQAWLLGERSGSLSDYLVKSGLWELDPARIESLVDQMLSTPTGLESTQRAPASGAPDEAFALAARPPAQANPDDDRTLETSPIHPDLTIPAWPRASELTTLAYESSDGIDLPDSQQAAPPRGVGNSSPADRFRIIRLHDQGGLGKVYLAHDAELNREVALKTLRDEYAGDQQSRVRFMLEAEVTGNLEHPGIVPVHSRGCSRAGSPYYAMRFVRGDSLKSAVDAHHASPSLKNDPSARGRDFHQLLRRFLTVCETVEYAHSRGILHRDLKPRNVLLGPFGETLVVDWGLAKSLQHAPEHIQSGETLHPSSGSDLQPTLAGSRIGTPAYMSPEQARGDVARVGPRSDVYSLGATLYYVLTGRGPFREDDVFAVCSRVERGEFPNPRSIRPELDRGLEAICLKAMAHAPEARYASAQALADDIERHLAGQPVLAYREPLPARAIRALRTRKRLVAAAAVMLGIGAVALAWHDWTLGIESARAQQATRATARQLGMTRQALRELLQTSAIRLASVPGSSPIREDLARIVLNSYKSLGEEYPADPEIRFESAQVHYLLAGLARITASRDESLANYQASLALLGPLENVSSARARARRLEIKIHIDRGTVLDGGGDSDGALAEYSTALERIAQERANLAADEAQGFAADCFLNRSEIHMRKRRFDAAASDAENAARVLEALVNKRENAAQASEDPSALLQRDETLVRLAMALTDLGLAEAGKGRKAEGERTIRTAIDRLAGVKTSAEATADVKAQLASSRLKLAELIAIDPSRHAAAVGLLDQAVKGLRELVSTQPDISIFRQDLAQALLSLAALEVESSETRNQAGKHLNEARQALQPLARASDTSPELNLLATRLQEIESRVQAEQGQDARTPRP